MIRRPPRSTRTDYLFPYPTRFRSWRVPISSHLCSVMASLEIVPGGDTNPGPVANGHNCDFMPLVFHCKNMRGGRARSEEHTSEPQSLMRISYAVFSLNKRNPLTFALFTTR